MIKLFMVGLQLMLIGLKLANAIDWNWWAVLLPFLSWITLGLLVASVHTLRYTFDRQYRLRVLLGRYANLTGGK